MISLKGVSKIYGEKRVLKDLRLSLAPHERIGLLGESGSGKSTILKLIAGIVEADGGEVAVESRHMGYIFQDHRLIPWKTAVENVAFSLLGRGFSRRAAEEKARTALAKVELGGYEHHYPGQLSGGMCQRVSIARAFVTGPAILLMDEPFSALDPSLKERMNRLVRGLLEESPACTIAVTHNEEELRGLVDKVYLLSPEGELKERKEIVTRRRGMSEQEMRRHLNPDEERMDKILEIKLKVIRKELDPEAARALVNRSFEKISAEEFAFGEQELLQYGVSDEAMAEEMDTMIAVFGDVLVKEEEELPPGHPIRTYREEAEALDALIAEILRKKEERLSVNQWLALFDKLGEINLHFSRKQNQLFPLLERKGFDRPSKVMWTFDNRVRDAVKQARENLEARREEEFLASLEEIGILVRDILEKERDILYPTALKLISREEFVRMRKGDDEIGYCLIDAPPAFGSAPPAALPGESSFTAELQALLRKHGMGGAGEGEVFDVDRGELTLEQINLIFRHLPVDLSYVDEEDAVRFYSDTRHRVFPRSPGVIGREVRNCHPKESVETVEAIIDAFRAGERDRAEFWLEMGEKFIYILYTAVRDKEGRYRGVLEMMQEAGRIRGLKGSQRLLNWEEEEPRREEQASSSGLSPETLIGPLVREHPYLKDFLVALNPKYKKLQNPVLFKTMGQVATLALIAERGGMDAAQLIALLKEEIERKG